ncbi:MAG: DUF4382 domain-containing protein [Desulfobulbaceae bacterium]|nr:DUF4382 domain-containing protein [Desulfobulbaceae bacterium]
MFKVIRDLGYFLAVSLMVMSLVSCGGGGSSGTAGVGTTGTLDIGLTDAPGDYLNVFVTIAEVQVKQNLEDDESGWITVATPDQTFDLLALQNGVIAPLGSTILEAGQYNQMRLILGTEPDDPAHPYANYLIIEGDGGEDPVEEELKVPSGFQTGIKIVQGFTIEASGSTELILDFNAEKSVVQAGKSGQWLLKPTIKVLETVTYSASGQVVDDTAVPLNGASISAQIYDSGAADPKDEITTAAGAVTALIDTTEGAYFMYLPITQDLFNIVATQEGYMPECQVLDSTSTGIMGYTMDFTLTPASATGTFVGSVNGLAAPGDSALFSIRQTNTTCGMIEVESFSLAEGATSTPVILPAGIYEVVVSADGEVTQVWNIEVVDSAETVMDAYFPTTSVEGIVGDGTALEGVLISAQVYDGGAVDPKDEVVEIIATDSDIGGAYFTYLPTNQSSFNIVATLEGYEPQCGVAALGLANSIDFALIASGVGTTGTISGSVNGLATATSALFSIRQDLAPCGMVEVASFSVAEGAAFSPINFPAGTYTVVVSAEAETTQVLVSPATDVVAGTDTPLNVVFPTP